MAWVEINRQYDHIFPNRAMKTYMPGRHNVPRDVADAAVAKGRGRIIEPPADIKSTKDGGTAPVEPSAQDG